MDVAVCERGRGLSRWAWVLLLAYAGSLFLFNLGGARTFTGHEGFVAEAAREMRQTGDWLAPRIAGKPWLEKPPLPYWSVAAASSLFGTMNEFVARLPSALAGLLGVALVASLAARWFGPTHGLLAGLVQATSLYTVTYARLAESDIYLWTLVLGCLWIFARLHVAPAADERWYSGRLLFFVLLGLTQLAKGPLFGAVLALLPCAGLIALEGRWRAFGWFLYWPGLLACAAISAAWPVAILLRYPDAAELWWIHTFARVGGDKVLNPNPFWYYFTTLPWQILPWTFVMLPALPAAFRRAWSQPLSPDRLLFLWLVLPFVALSAVQAKHHHYLIYALPPCSFWAADGLLRWRDLAAKWLSGRRLAVAGAFAVLAAAGGIWAVHKFAPQHRGDAIALAAIALLTAGVTAWACRQHRSVLAGIALFGGLWLGYGEFHWSLLPATDQYRDETRFLARLSQRVPLGKPVLILGLEPSRLMLYLDCPVEVFTDIDQLRDRSLELPDAPILTTVGHEYQLRQRGTLVCLEKMPPGRWKHLGPFAQLGWYRVEWFEPGAVATRAGGNPQSPERTARPSRKVGNLGSVDKAAASR